MTVLDQINTPPARRRTVARLAEMSDFGRRGWAFGVTALVRRGWMPRNGWHHLRALGITGVPSRVPVYVDHATSQITADVPE